MRDRLPHRFSQVDVSCAGFVIAPCVKGRRKGCRFSQEAKPRAVRLSGLVCQHRQIFSQISGNQDKIRRDAAQSFHELSVRFIMQISDHGCAEMNAGVSFLPACMRHNRTAGKPPVRDLHGKTPLFLRIRAVA